MRNVFSLLLLVAALPLWADQQKVSRDVFRDPGRLTVVDTATKIEACILHVKDPSKGQDLNQRAFVEGRYATLPQDVSTLVIWKLIDDRSYTWDAVPACIPTYNARVRFSSGHRVVEVDFCFSCAQMIVREDGATVGAGYFESGNDWVFRAIARQFPKDPVIRDLKKRREEAEIYRLDVEMAKARDARRKKANQPPQPTPASRGG